MTINERAALAAAKIEHWTNKSDHATAMLTKWRGHLAKLQKTQPTKEKLPRVTLVTGSEHLLPNAAVTTAGEKAAAEALARASALADMEKEAGDPAARYCP